MVETAIVEGYHVRLRSGDEIKCHQHDEDKETQVHVLSATTMHKTGEYTGLALMEGSRYAKDDIVTFCKGCYKEIISAGRCNCG